jgi:membrane-associated protein
MVIEFLSQYGYLAIALVTFIEYGTVFGLFIPAGTLFVIFLGMLSASGIFDIELVFFTSFIFAIIGNVTAYYSGVKVGSKMFSKYCDNMRQEKIKESFRKYGDLIVLGARVIPFAGVFSCIFAGIVKMNFKRYLILSTIGSLVWICLILLLGYYFGSFILSFLCSRFSYCFIQ